MAFNLQKLVNFACFIKSLLNNNRTKKIPNPYFQYDNKHFYILKQISFFKFFGTSGF